jgi:glucuronokinase
MIIRTKAYPRAGLVGNPSDGYFGKTISFAFTDFCAEVTLYETPELEILPGRRDHSRFTSIHQLAGDVRLHGYYGGLRLLRAAIKRFHDYCTEQGITLHDRNFTLSYQSNIPQQVGLAGSSAIITACLRALMTFYGVSIPLPAQANLILSVETKELGIPAGLQDRVAQVYQGAVFMDFDRALMARQGYGYYEPIDPALLPLIYVAFRDDLSEGTEVFHNNLRARWETGEPAVLEAMQTWAGLAVSVRDLIKAGRGGEIGPLLDRNFDLRRKLVPLSDGNIRMVEAARSVGASAKFAGSGGAIVGTCRDEAMFQALEKRMANLHITTLRPQLAPPTGEPA